MLPVDLLDRLRKYRGMYPYTHDKNFNSIGFYRDIIHDYGHYKTEQAMAILDDEQIRVKKSLKRIISYTNSGQKRSYNMKGKVK